MSLVEKAMHSQEQLSQVIHFSSTLSRAAQGTQAPKADQQSQNDEPLPLLLQLFSWLNWLRVFAVPKILC